MNACLFLLAPLLLLPGPARAQQPEAPEVRWDEAPFRGLYRTPSGGAELIGRLGHITVPENRQVDGGRTVELAFVYYESPNPEAGPPLVYLVGGPGGAGTEHGASFAMHPILPVLEYGDVIALDQRGVGRSVPNLAAGPDLSYELPLDGVLTQADEDRAFAEQVARGRAYWEAQGVELGSFNTRESADDIDDLRRALGLERIRLWGGSYGSHLGLAYLRRHGEHVERAILTKVEGPDHTFKLPSTVQRHLEALGAEVAADPVLGERMPDLVGLVRDLLADLEREPVEVDVPRGGATVTVRVGPYDLCVGLANAMGELRGYSRIPAELYRLVEGDWSEMGRNALDRKSGEVWSMMTVMMDAASGASPARWARIEREARDPRNVLGDAINAPFGPAVRRASGAPDLGAEFRAPLRCDVPVLFVTGSLDVRTPPENVAEIRAGFSRSVHLAIEGVSHDSFEMLSPDYQGFIKAWLRGEELADRTLVIDEMRFASFGD